MWRYLVGLIGLIILVAGCVIGAKTEKEVTAMFIVAIGFIVAGIMIVKMAIGD